MVQALIIVDYENEWIDGSSPYYVGDITENINRLNKLIRFCRSKKIPLIFTTHIEPESTTAFADGTDRVEIMKCVDFDKASDILIKKHRISPFFRTALESKLRQLRAKEVIITGALTNLCVRSCVSDAYDRDYKITVITDPCVAISSRISKFTLEDLKETRPEIELMTVRQFIGQNRQRK